MFVGNCFAPRLHRFRGYSSLICMIAAIGAFANTHFRSRHAHCTIVGNTCQDAAQLSQMRCSLRHPLSQGAHFTPVSVDDFRDAKVWWIWLLGMTLALQQKLGNIYHWWWI